MTDEAKKYVVGREGDLKIKKNIVSGKHCQIWKQSGVVFLEDTSTNGTFIKGERIPKRKPQIITSGTKITIVKANPKSNISEITFLYLDGEEEQKGGVFDKYVLTETLGAGAFAEVRLGVHKETHEQFAIKIISKKKYCKSSDSERLMDEVNILREISHPGVVGIEDVFDGEEYLYLVLELVTGGELFDLINSKGLFKEDEARDLVKQMIDTLVYLHGKGIAHRDLKFENILLKDKNYDKIKISDFGLSRIIKEGSFMQTICGTPEYIAPEVLKSKSTSGYGKAVDLWSLGVILYTMLCGMRPFEGSEGNNVLSLVKKGIYSYPDDVELSKEAIDLIDKMLTIDPAKRITADEAAVHPWILNKELEAEESHTLLEKRSRSESQEVQGLEDEPPAKKSRTV